MGRQARSLWRHAHAHRGLVLLAAMVCGATLWIACGGDDRTFGPSEADSGTVNDGTSTDGTGTSSDTPADNPAETVVDTNLDDTPSTSD